MQSEAACSREGAMDLGVNILTQRDEFKLECWRIRRTIAGVVKV